MLDLDAEIADLKAEVQLRKLKKTYRSKIDKYRPTVLALRKKGATMQMLQIWLEKRNIKVARSTISRWLQRNV